MFLPPLYAGKILAYHSEDEQRDPLFVNLHSHHQAIHCPIVLSFHAVPVPATCHRRGYLSRTTAGYADRTLIHIFLSILNGSVTAKKGANKMLLAV